MNPPRKLTAQQRADEQQSLAQNQDARLQPIHQFASVEAMLRHDAVHTPVPPTIAHRLQQSLGPARSSAKSWWRRLFSS